MKDKARKPTTTPGSEPASGGGGTPGALERPAENRARLAGPARRGARCGLAREPSAGPRARELEADLPRGRVEEAAAMRRAVSPGTGRRYPLTMICAVFRVPRSTVYLAMTAAPIGPVIQAKRGPKTPVSDSEIVTAIRAVLAATPFHGEGYRKIRARLAHRGFAIGGKRVLRLLRQHQLLAPRRLGPPKWGSRARRYDHDGAAGRDVGHRRDALLHRGGRLVLVLRRDRSLRRRARRLAHGEDRRSLGRARAPAAGRAPRVRQVREGGRPRLADPVRLGTAVHRRRVDQRGEVARDDDHAVVRGRAGVQWRHRALHAHAQRAMPVSPSLPEPRRGAPTHRRVHHALQHRVAHRAARPSDAGSRARGGDGGVTDESRSPVASGSTIDDGGAMLISPSRVQKTGSDTKPFSSSPWVRAGSRRQEVVALAERRKTRFSVRQRTVGGRQRKDGARSGWGPSGVLDYAA